MSSMFPWYILLTPLLSAAVITVLTHRSRTASSFISVVAVIVTFVLSCIVFSQPDAAAADFSWISLPGFTVPLGLILDPLSRTMLLVVTGVGALIHIYSLGYMRDDEGKSRYFAALSLFMFAMLG